MSTKKKVIIGIIISVALIGLIFGIITIYRFFKLQKIWSKVDSNIEKDNFYLETTIINNGVSRKTQTYYKEGIGKFVSQDGKYIWFDGTKAYSINPENKTAEVLKIEETVGLVYNASFASLYPGYSESYLKRLLFAGDISNKIKTENHNGEKCIIIIDKDENVTKTYWITKDSYNLIQAKIEFSNGDLFEYKYNIKYHSTRITDVELPNMKEYTITETPTINEKQKVDENKKENTIVQNVINNVETIPVV